MLAAVWTVAWFVPLDVAPPSNEFGFLPIMLLALLGVGILVAAVVFGRFRNKKKG